MELGQKETPNDHMVVILRGSSISMVCEWIMKIAWIIGGVKGVSLRNFWLVLALFLT
jgi:hypothetical protein